MRQITLTEIEQIIASDLLENEYNPAKPDQREFLANSAARRLVQALKAGGYEISKT